MDERQEKLRAEDLLSRLYCLYLSGNRDGISLETKDRQQITAYGELMKQGYMVMNNFRYSISARGIQYLTRLKQH